MSSMSRYLSRGATVSYIALSAAAWAQTAASNASVTTSEIVVTAQKRPELLSKAPLAISAFKGATLTAEGVTTALSLDKLVPSLQIQQANGVQITIRGVSSPDGTEKGDPAAAFLLNGVYLARQQALDGAFFDLDRVEVLKGPQGTLYGKNATAGVVNVITNEPRFAYEGAANFEVGDYGTLRGGAMLNVPITNDFAVRGAIDYCKHGSYLVDAGAADNRRLGDDQNDVSLRLSSLLNFGKENQGSFYLVGDFSHQGGAGPLPVLMSNFFKNDMSADPVYYNGGSKEQRTVAYPFVSDPQQDNKNYGIMGRLQYDFGPLTATYIGSDRTYDRYNLSPFVYPALDTYPNQFAYGISREQSNEFRVSTSNGAPVDAVAGLYYFNQNFHSPNLILNNFAGFPVYAFLYPMVHNTSKAVFGQATYHVMPELRLTAGWRYSQDYKSRIGETVIQTNSTVLNPADYEIAGINNANKTFSKMNWKLGADYDVTPKILAYATIATGYKAGGFNDGCAAGSPDCASPVAASRLFYRPEELTDYEGGVKGRYFGGRLSLNLGGFFYDYTNLQLDSVQSGLPAQVTLNAGKAHITGAELEAVVMPDPLDRFDVSFTYLNARYEQYEPLAGLSWAGRPLDNSPNAVLFAAYTRTIPLDNGGKIAARVESRVSSSYVESDFTVPVQFRQPAFTKTDLSLTYSAPKDKWYLEAYANNLENAIQFTGYENNAAYVTDPRTWGVRGGIKF